LLTIIAFSFSVGKEGKIEFSKNDNQYSFENTEIKFEFDNQMRCNVYRKSDDGLLSIVRQKDSPHFLIINGIQVKEFIIDPKKVEVTDIQGESGKGKRLQMPGLSEGPSSSEIEKILTIDMYDKFPNAGLVSVEYRNVGSTPGLRIEKEVDNSFNLDASLLNSDYGRHAFWILQGGSYRFRPDWIIPVTDTLSFENYMGKDESKCNAGGGLPVLDVWNKETGFFIGSIREKPTLISLPAKVDADGYLQIGIEYKRDIEFGAERYKTIPTVIGVHKGDFFNGLSTYSAIMADRGFKMLELKPKDPVYGAVWCGWGLGPDFTQKQMTGMIPTLKEFHFNTVTVDDGWFKYYGDFVPKPTIFPGGDEDVAQFIDTFHKHGYPVKLWMTPGVGGEVLMAEHPEWFLRDENGSMVTVDRFEVRRKAAFLCPVLQEVQDYYKDIVDLVINKWGYDGFKMDFEITNAMGLCYAPEHNHQSLTESFEALPIIYKIISEETRKLKPKAILEMCPCGMFPSFYKMPYYNQAVASDPNSTWQIRHRGKIIKALMGPGAAFYGDHVERFYSKNNFASMVGVGGIPGTKFVAIETDDGFLGKKYPVWMDPERRVNFEIWLKVYKDHRLTSGKYLNLYDIIYDKPETHVIKKDDILYYSFYSSEWDGEVELKGLEEKEYVITDYVNDKVLGKVKGSEKLNVTFNDHLLVRAVLAEKK
jgi:alpha-galactosidase